MLAPVLLPHLYGFITRYSFMKKLLLLSVLALLSATAFAQDDVSDSRIDFRKFRIGLFAAPTISWMRPTTNTSDNGEFRVSNEGTVPGFTWGLMIDKYFAPNYAIATGLQYNSTGGHILAFNTGDPGPSGFAPNTVGSADFRYRLQYLEVPFHLKLRSDDLSGFYLFGQGGVTGGINIGKKADYTVQYWDEAGNPQTASADGRKIMGGIGNIAPVLLQFNVGGGVEYALGEKLRLYVGVFFNNGFAPDATNPNDFDEEELGYSGEFRDANTRLNNMSLKLGLFF